MHGSDVLHKNKDNFSRKFHPGDSHIFLTSIPSCNNLHHLLGGEIFFCIFPRPPTFLNFRLCLIGSSHKVRHVPFFFTQFKEAPRAF